jgi:uncharacterized protein (TIGR02145 family)
MKTAHSTNPILSILLIGVIGVQTTFTLSCSGNGDDNNGGGGGKGNDIANYKTKQIGTQVWMTENLDYAVSGSKCYNNDPASCEKYGRLYDWATAMALPSNCNNSTCTSQINSPHKGICPSDWHIPSDDEWQILVDFAGGADVAGTKLKAASGWNDYIPCDKYSEDGENCEVEGAKQSGSGTNELGFFALPGGTGNSAGRFGNAGNGGNWLSASEAGSFSKDGETSYLAYIRHMDYSRTYVLRIGHDKPKLGSVRCVKD